MSNKRDLKNTPKVLGLDISTKTIGWSLFEIQTQELLELTHFSPVIKPKVEDKIQELLITEKYLVIGEAAKQREKLFFSKLVYEQKISSLINSL